MNTEQTSKNIFTLTIIFMNNVCSKNGVLQNHKFTQQHEYSVI